ncbi:MAG: hypothetical protein LBS55_14960 [Prevotellaceae bacterium]|nr:hypothetical protein [Prevotellaceae bacterium]
MPVLLLFLPLSNKITPADISYVETATKMIIPYLKTGGLFVIEFTLPVMTTEIWKECLKLKDNVGKQ